jgi:hypothetical protein
MVARPRVTVYSGARSMCNVRSMTALHRGSLGRRFTARSFTFIYNMFINFLLFLSGLRAAWGIFDIDSFGAVPGTFTRDVALKNGQALVAAFAAANASSSSRAVLVRGGQTYSYLPAVNSIDGLSDMVFYLEGELALFTENFSDTKAPYPGWPNPLPPINFNGCTNLLVTSEAGTGILNGRGNNWWWYTIFVGDHRPNLFEANQCVNFTLRGITFVNSPQYHVLLSTMDGALIENVTVRVDIEDQLDVFRYIGGGPARTAAVSSRNEVADILRAAQLVGPADDAQLIDWVRRAALDDAHDEELQFSRRGAIPSMVSSAPWFNASWAITPPVPMIWALNTDGIDFSGKNIAVKNCSVTNFDDSVCVKPAGGDAATGGCTHNVSISDISVTYGVGVSMGSVPPHDDGNCIDNVFAHHIVFDTPLKALYVKPNPSDGPSSRGAITNIRYEDIIVNNALWWPIFVGLQQQHQPGSSSGTGCPFIFPLLNTSCPSDPQVTLANLTFRRIDIFGGICAPGILLANETNPGTGFVFDSVVGHNVSVWPFSGYLVKNIHGNVSGSTPVPQIQPSLPSYEEWAKREGREPRADRAAIFAANMAVAAAHNARDSATFTLGATPFADLTLVEFRERILTTRGARPSILSNLTSAPGDALPSAIPSAANWSLCMAPVHNEGACSNAWAYAAADELESVCCLSSGADKSLSFQEVIDCAGRGGCNGGFLTDAYQFFSRNGGLCKTSDYPPGVGKCRSTTCTPICAPKGFVNVASDSRDAFLTALSKQPLVFLVAADSQVFQLYTAGVITSVACGTTVDQPLVAVSYDMTAATPFVTGKNEWGNSWGENGFVRISLSMPKGPGTCGIYQASSFITM